MRIALISQEYPPETAHGGIGTQTYQKAHGLASLGHEVYVVSHSLDDHKHNYMDGRVFVRRIPSYDEQLPIHTEQVRWLVYSVGVATALMELHSLRALDFVDFPEWGGEGYIYLLNRTKWNYIPAVIHIHGPLVMIANNIGWPEKNSEFYRVGTEMEGTCLRLADAVFSSSKCSAEWCARHYGLELKNIPIIHSGIDTNLFYPFDIPKEDRPTVIFVGRIEKSKGVVTLFEAVCQLADEVPGLRLRLIGRGNKELIDELLRKARACGQPNLLDFIGFVSKEELPSYLCRAHVFAAPSIYEGGPGFVYLEAMACGLPVIACEGSGAAEVVISGENGLLVPPENLKALVNSLRRLLSDAEKRHALGMSARRYACQVADSKLCLKKIETFYTETAFNKNVKL